MAKRVEVWLDEPTLALVDAAAAEMGVGRGKAIAALLRRAPSGGSEPAAPVIEPEVSAAAVVVVEREVPKGPARQRYSYGREGLELLEADLEIYGQERLCELLGVKASTLNGYHGQIKHFKDWEPPVEGPKRRSRNIAAAVVVEPC